MTTEVLARPWTPRPLGELLAEEDVRATDIDGGPNLEVLSLTKRLGLIPQTERFTKRVATENVDNYKVVQPGWITYNPFVLWEGAIHALRRAAPGVVSPAYVTWRRVEDDHGYLDHLLRAPVLIDRYKRLSSGAVNRRRTITKDAFRAVELPMPPVEQQRTVADALNALQQAKSLNEQLAELSRDVRQATLEHLIKNGISGQVRDDDSDHELPEGWRLPDLEELAVSIDYGTSVKCSYESDGLPVLRIPNVIGGVVSPADLKYGTPTAREMTSARLRDGDLLFVRTNGAKDNAGRCAVFHDEIETACYFASYLIRVRVDEVEILPDFLNEYLKTDLGRSYLSGRSVRTADGKYNINSGTLRTTKVRLPKKPEQAVIVERLQALDVLGREVGDTPGRLLT